MNRPYLIFYRGILAERHVTGKGALKAAKRLAIAKGWKLEDVRIELEVSNATLA